VQPTTRNKPKLRLCSCLGAVEPRRANLVSLQGPDAPLLPPAASLSDVAGIGSVASVTPPASELSATEPPTLTQVLKGYTGMRSAAAADTGER
jgi:hypothetical protein